MEGSVVSLGSGLSMIERYLTELEPELWFEGIDCDPEKVTMIEQTRHRSPRVSLIPATQRLRSSPSPMTGR